MFLQGWVNGILINDSSVYCTLCIVLLKTLKIQSRRRVLKSGTAIERLRCSPSAEGTSGGEHERGFDPLS